MTKLCRSHDKIMQKWLKNDTTLISSSECEPKACVQLLRASVLHLSLVGVAQTCGARPASCRVGEGWCSWCAWYEALFPAEALVQSRDENTVTAAGFGLITSKQVQLITLRAVGWARKHEYRVLVIALGGRDGGVTANYLICQGPVDRTSQFLFTYSEDQHPNG